MIEKIISFLLLPLMFFHTLFPAFVGISNEESFSKEDISQLHSLSDYIDYVKDNGAPVFSTDASLRYSEPVVRILEHLTGRLFVTEDNEFIKTEIDERVTLLCDTIKNDTELDLVSFFKAVPNLNYPAEFINKVLRVDTDKFRDEMFKLRDKAYASDNGPLGHMLYLLGVYFSVINELYIYAETNDSNPEEFSVIVDIIYLNGEKETIDPGIVVNTSTGECHGNSDKGIVDLGFDFNYKDLLIYGVVNSWERALGYSVFYDAFSNSMPVYNMDTRRFKFEYAGKDWMIQIWKGNYVLVANGLEVGIYNREKRRIGTHYNAASDDEMIKIDATLYHGDKLILHKGPVYHWWLSVFKLGRVLYLPSELTMKFSLEMPDEEMLKAFTDAVENHGAHDVSYTVENLTVYLEF